MLFRSFFFFLFITASFFFFFSTYQPSLTLNVYSLISSSNLGLSYIHVTSMITSTIALTLYVITNYYAEKKLLEELKRRKRDRLNIEKIHAELEALRG